MQSIDASLPIKITAIVIKGNERTKDVYFQNEFSDYSRCRNIGDLHQHLFSVTQNLQHSGLFEAVETNIRIGSTKNTANVAINDGNDSLEQSAYTISVDVTVKEVGIPQLKMESYIQTGSGVNSGGGALQASIRNPLGYGEITRISLGSNTSDGKECSLITTIPHIKIPNIIKPLLNPLYRMIKKNDKIDKSKISAKNSFVNLNEAENIDEDIVDKGILQLIMKKTEENQSHFMSYKSILHTIGTEYKSQYGTHTINTELTQRDELPVPYQSTPHNFLLGNIPQKVLSNNFFTPPILKARLVPHAKSASQEILSNINSSSKTSIQYTFLKDDRTTNNPVLGSYIQSSIELAVPSGVQSAQYLRTDLTAQTNFKVQPFQSCDSGMVASFSGTLGALWPLPFKDQFQAYLTDRYHAGGPMSVRGFNGYGIGPRSPPSTLIPTSTSTSEIDGSIHHGDSLGGFAKSTFLGTLSVPLDLKCIDKNAARAFFFLNAGSVGMGFKANPIKEDSNGFNIINDRRDERFNLMRKNYHPESNTIEKPDSSNNINGINPDKNIPFFGYVRASIGAGVSLTLSPAIKLEVTYSIPILKSSHDITKPFQLGVGLSLS